MHPVQVNQLTNLFQEESTESGANGGCSSGPAVAMSLPLLGNLLISAEVVAPQVVVQAVEIAEKVDADVGDVLVSAGKVARADVVSAKQAEKLVKEDVMNIGFAVRALRHSSQHFVPLDDALHSLDLHRSQPFSTSQLCEVLDRARIVSHQDLNAAKKESLRTGLSIGRCLIREGKLTASALKIVLDGLNAIRTGVMPIREFSETLRRSLQRPPSQDYVSSLMPLSFESAEMKLAELLICCQLLSEMNLLSAVEWAVEEGTDLKKTLVTYQLVSEKTISQAHEVLDMLEKSSISARQAQELLKQVVSSGSSVGEALEEQKRIRTRVLYILKRAGVVSQAEISQASVCVQFEPDDPLRAVTAEHGLALDTKLFQVALQLVAMVEGGSLDVDAATNVLRECHRYNISLEQALKKVAKVTINMDPK